MADRERIIEILGRMQQRDRLDRRVEAITDLVIYALLSFAFVKVVGWYIPLPAWIGQGTALGAFLIWVLRHRVVFLQRHCLMEVAVEVDRIKNLKDELRTAVWFIESRVTSPWVDLQVHRAAERARGLDLKRLYPLVVPRRLLMAIPLVVPFFFTPPISFLRQGQPSARPSVLSQEQKELFGNLDRFLGPSTARESQEARRRLAKLRQGIEQGNVSMDVSQRMFSEIENALVSGPLDSSSVWEAVEEIAENLRVDPSMEKVSKALLDHDLEGAAAQLRTLGPQLRERQPAEQLNRLRKSLDVAARTRNSNLRPFMEALKNLSSGMTNDSEGTREEAIERAADALNDLSERLRNQMRRRAASRDVARLRKSFPLSRDPSADSSLEGNQDSSEEMRAEGSSRRGSGRRREGSRAGGALDARNSANPGQGRMASNSGGGHHQGRGEPTELDVQLHREEVEGIPGNGKEASRPTDRVKSRLEPSKVGYSQVQRQSTFPKAESAARDFIPWEYRALIKGYFKGIHTGGKGIR